ncbi:hypothetical protein M9458_008954, partial [Cirrhinus mrigala]
ESPGDESPPTPTAGAWLRKVALLRGQRPDDGDVAWGGGCDESAASPLTISFTPSVIAALHQAPDGSGRVGGGGGALKHPGLAA